ncbi:MAG TPA: DUF3761 domain-containing protein [Terracidiphilus sp.]|nr:DUF3761 domain-containing protein [Terracidiphilus sp.]
MKRNFLITILAAFVFTPIALAAQAPSGATGQCKDGTYTTAASKRGACRGHQGVATWFADSGASKAKSTKTKSTTSTKASKTPAAAPAPAAKSSSSGATGQCKDGTYTTAASKRGACRGHQGVATWYADAGATKASKARASSSAPAASPAPVSKPSSSGATGQCKDGTYTTAANKRGACRGHQGVATWYADASAPGKSSTPVSAPAPTSSPAPTRAKSAPAMRPNGTVAPGGGSGMVWVNTDSNVYHCQGDKYYGTTKEGKYVSESQARAMGARPSRGKACSQ